MLSKEDYLRVVRDAPLVSVDLIVRDAQGLVLIGLRQNRPAQGSWFVPGGVIRAGMHAGLGYNSRSLQGVTSSTGRAADS